MNTLEHIDQGPQVLDPGSFPLSGGGTIYIISASVVASPQLRERARIADHEEVWRVLFEVNDPIPGDIDTFTVGESVSGPVRNAFGARFVGLVRAPSYHGPARDP